jgi:hypothetical protein
MLVFLLPSRASLWGLQCRPRQERYQVRDARDFLERIPPLSLVSMCIRQPGPKRTFEERYEVPLLDQRITREFRIAPIFPRVL